LRGLDLDLDGVYFTALGEIGLRKSRTKIFSSGDGLDFIALGGIGVQDTS